MRKRGKIPAQDMTSLNDRRKRVRMDVHWTVHLSRKWHGIPVESKTRNLSSDGFYCLSHEPFTPGERLECMLLIPAQERGSQEGALCLQCRVQVVRVETAREDGGFGIACRLVDYSVVQAPKPVMVSTPYEVVDRPA